MGRRKGARKRTLERGDELRPKGSWRKMSHVNPMVRRVLLGLAAAGIVLSCPGHAVAATSVTLPAGGAGRLAVSVDVAAGTMTVNGAARKLPLAAMPAADDVTVEAVPLGGGKQVVHVRVPEKDADTKAYEAVLAPGGAEVFAGLTGFGDGDPG